VYDTFQAAYDAARQEYKRLSEIQKDVYLVSEEICCKDLQGSWGMSQAQKEEIALYLNEPQKDAQQGRGEQRKPSLSERIQNAADRRSQASDETGSKAPVKSAEKPFSESR